MNLAELKDLLSQLDAPEEAEVTASGSYASEGDVLNVNVEEETYWDKESGALAFRKVVIIGTSI